MQSYAHFIYPAAAVLAALCLSVLRLSPYVLSKKPLVVLAVAAISLHFFLGGWHEAATAFLCGIIAVALFSILRIAGGVPMRDIAAIGIVALAAGRENAVPLFFFTAIIGAIMAIVATARRQRIRQFLHARVREATHAAYDQWPLSSNRSIEPEHGLRRQYAHAVTLGSLLVLVQAVTF